MTSLTTRKMSDRHEEDLVALLGGERTRNSGAVWSDQADGHQTGLDQYYRFTWDSKSTLGKSIGVSREMLKKLREQARGLEPMLPLRWYANDRLTEVDEDWIAVPAETQAALIEDANKYRLILEVGCLSGDHDFAEVERESRYAPAGVVMDKIGDCRGCGRAPYSALIYTEQDLQNAEQY